MTKTMRAIVGSMLLACMVAPTAASAQTIQCAPFARMFSGIQLFGAAASWWNQAVGSMRSGHVATVTQVVSDRVIKITHANWSIINGRRGQVERDVTVVDASPNGDWSKVKVWFAPIGKVGNTAYPVNGFIYKDGKSAPGEAQG